MWCANCETDVAAEVAPDSRRIRCATCGSELSANEVPSFDAKIQEARAILERWSNNDMFDPYGPLPAAGRSAPAGLEDERAKDEQTGDAQTTVPPSDAGHAEAAQEASTSREPAVETRQSAPSSRSFRVDPPHVESPQPEAVSRSREAPSQPVPSGEPPIDRVEQDEAPARPNEASGRHRPGPHFELHAEMRRNHDRKINWMAGIGQLLAYLGVLGLTAGTSLVVVGYFGGVADYMPTGWLVTTASQMLLFLGVITLVSNGMEQTREAVVQRMDVLEAHLLRLEESSSRGAAGDSTAAREPGPAYPRKAG